MITAKTEREAPDTHLRRPAHLAAVGSEGVRRELVRRIVHSPTFARSERLGTLLTYVCDLALKGREAEINEQMIGQSVFDRPQDYDTAADGIVRSQASRLRQRLELYFQQEGADEPIRVLIPRGGYVPVFEANGISTLLPAVADRADAIPAIVPLTPAQIGGPHPRDSFFRKWSPWGLSLMLAVMLAALWVHDRRALRLAAVAAPPAHPFWSHLFTRNQPTMVVAPDSGLVLYHGMSGRDIDLKEYLDAGYRSEPAVLPQIGPSVTL